MGLIHALRLTGKPAQSQRRTVVARRARETLAWRHLAGR